MTLPPEPAMADEFRLRNLAEILRNMCWDIRADEVSQAADRLSTLLEEVERLKKELEEIYEDAKGRKI